MEQKVVLQDSFLWLLVYVFALYQGKHPDEAMDISDKLFIGIMRGNKIKPEIKRGFQKIGC